jgi:nicotinate phosphoribosyltransferase
MTDREDQGLISADPNANEIESEDLLHSPERVTGTALYTDLYHVDAAYLAWKSGHNGLATFDLFTRRSPFAGGYMLFTGLQPSLDYLRSFTYTQEDLDWLERIKGYNPDFLHYLSNLNFTGEIMAMDEGEIAFPNEPMIRVTAPFAEAMLIESGLLRTVGISTLLATKAARIRLAAKDRSVSDFAFRRAHAPFIAARSGYIGGCDSTSFVAAAKDYDIPGSGTIPHAIVQAFPDELTAFRTVAETLPSFTLLLDTYDVSRGIENAITAAQEVGAKGHVLTAVRLDSGDLGEDSVMVRRKLDEAGMKQVKVLVSGDIDEYRIESLLATGAPIDGFGVGGNLGVGLGTIESGTVGGVIGAVYKLAWIEDDSGRPARLKVAGSKSTWPGRKMVYRMGDFDRDIIALDTEAAPVGSRTLLTPWIMEGRLVRTMPDIHEIRTQAMANLHAMPEWMKALTPEQAYPVDFSDDIVRLREESIRAFGGHVDEDSYGRS